MIRGFGGTLLCFYFFGTQVDCHKDLDPDTVGTVVGERYTTESLCSNLSTVTAVGVMCKTNDSETERDTRGWERRGGRPGGGTSRVLLQYE